MPICCSIIKKVVWWKDRKDMGAVINHKTEETLKPPITSVGVIGWLKVNLFNGWFNSLLTIVAIYALWKIIPPFLQWAVFDSVWGTSGAVCRETDGACWSIVKSNLRFIIFGFYPYDLQWRPLAAMMILAVLLAISQNRRFWKKWPPPCRAWSTHESF